MKITEQFFSFVFQAPRRLSQLDLEKALSTTRTMVAANEYDGLNQQSSSRRTFPVDSGDYQAAINELYKVIISRMISQPDSQDP